MAGFQGRCAPAARTDGHEACFNRCRAGAGGHQRGPVSSGDYRTPGWPLPGRLPIKQSKDALLPGYRLSMPANYTVALAKGQGMPSETIQILKAWQEGMTAVQLKRHVIAEG